VSARRRRRRRHRRRRRRRRYYYVEHRIFARSDLQCPAQHVLFTLAQLAEIIIII